MELDDITDWYYDVIDWFTSIDLSFITDFFVDRFTFLEFLSFGDDVDQFAILLSGGTGMMLAYFWLLDPLGMGMNLIPLYLRLSAILISTIGGYYFAKKLLGG